MKKAAVVIGLVLFALYGQAFEEFGSLADAKAQHPDIFVPNAVVECDVNGVPSYVFNGGSFNLKAGDSGVFRRAELAAKTNLRNFLTQKDPSKQVEMKGSAKMYEFSEGKKMYVVCHVPRDMVTVTVREVPEPQPVPANNPTSTPVVEAPQTVAPQPAAEPTQPVAGPTQPVAGTVQQTSAENNAKPVAETVSEPAAVTKPETAVQTDAPAAEEKEDDLTVCLKLLERQPKDCSTLSHAALLYDARRQSVKVSEMYARLVASALEDRSMDGQDLIDWLFEAAKYEEQIGNFSTAIRYYRYVCTESGLRRINAEDSVKAANAKVSELMLRQ